MPEQMPDPSEPLLLLAPLSGVLLPLAAVPDPVFADGLFGDGVAIDPLSGTLLAPCDGTVVHLAVSGHALTLQAPGGAQVLLHIGIDTVTLRGEGFAPCVAPGDTVRQGDVLIRFDVDAVARLASSLVTVMAIANGEAFAVTGRTDAALAEAGRTVLLQVRAARAGRQAQPGAGAAEHRHTVTLACPGGLHARPAARAREAARGLVPAWCCTTAPARPTWPAWWPCSASPRARAPRWNWSRPAPMPRPRSQRWRTNCSAPAQARTSRGQAPRLSCVPRPSCRRAACRASPPRPASPSARCTGGARPCRNRPRPAGHRRRTRRIARRAGIGRRAPGARERRRQRAPRRRRGRHLRHRALLEDPALLAAAETHLAAGKSAGLAWREATRAEAAVLSAMADHRMAERAGDLLDLQKRVLRALAPADAGHGTLAGHLPAADAGGDPIVLAAEEFTPSDLAGLDRTQVKALVMVRGGPTSHAAIIARQLGMPCLVAMGNALERLPDGTPVIADGGQGRLHASPDAHMLAAAASAARVRAQQREADLHAAHAAAATRDGVGIEVAANIGSLDDARNAVAHGADAVGLLRTELLFLHGREAPTAADHTAACQAIADALQGRGAIVRTLDIGGDKDAAWLRLPPEGNPALGLRGVRLAQVRPHLLDDQLRGLLAVRAPAPLRILLPMVSEVGELVAWRERIRALALEAGAQTGADPAVEVGVMIEVPSAALLADQLAEHADFFSIGTNDLTQYTLAMDRCQPALAARMDGLHPAVLRMVAATTAGAARHGRWVGVCGALAGDPLAVPVLLGLGVTELSVDAGLVPGIKARVRALAHADCRQRAGDLLRLPSATAVRDACRQYWPV